ncbi:MAG TPA: DNA repair protein RecN [Mycobacteriales bacterium]|nr:DNA repair protein RecN [Mycobacteriales bacterium]
MLSEIRIRGLGVIEDVTLELGPGLTVVTGETGAGKTMVVTGLHLLFGGRADPARVRSGSGRAVVDGRLRLPVDSPVLDRARDAGAEVDEDGELLVSRAIAVEGRSRAFLGGSAVPAGLLGEIAEGVLALHGQSDQLRLLRPAEQRASLDRYAGQPAADLLERHRAAYGRWQQLAADLADRTARVRELAREADVLRHGLAEIAAVEPQPGEDGTLAAEAEKLAHSDALRLAAQTAHDALVGDPADPAAADADVTGLLGAARRALAHSSAADPELAALEKRLDEVAYLVADVATELASYAERTDADPARLAEVEDRRAALKALTRKYGDGIDEVLAWAADADERLSTLDVSEDALAALAAERDAAAAEVAGLAGELSGLRAAAAERFGAAVTAELAGLAMPRAAVTVELRRKPATGDSPAVELAGERVTVGPDGVDEVEVLLRPHAGAPPLPVQRGASGGELSRVMLAVEVVFAGADPVPTMVFDEVDAGVGGRAAVEVGRRLARLARDHQVLVVTHLPQVAAYADAHVVVDKADSEGALVTKSDVRVLDDAGRVRELARMLAGLEGSELGRAHAEELLATAAADRRAS